MDSTANATSSQIQPGSSDFVKLGGASVALLVSAARFEPSVWRRGSVRSWSALVQALGLSYASAEGRLVRPTLIGRIWRKNEIVRLLAPQAEALSQPPLAASKERRECGERAGARPTNHCCLCQNRKGRSVLAASPPNQFCVSSVQRGNLDYSASATPAKIALRVPFLRPSFSMTRAPLSRLNML